MKAKCCTLLLQEGYASEKKHISLWTAIVMLLTFMMAFSLPSLAQQPAVNLDQAGNGKYTAVQDPMQWQNGNLNPNQAHYVEKHSIPYRVIMTAMPVGQEVTLTMNFDIVHSGKYALDFITGYQQLQPHNYVNHNTEETVNPLAGGYSGTEKFLDIPAPAYLPADPLADFNGLPAEDRKISIFGADWNATWNGGIGISYTYPGNVLVLDNVDKKVSFTVKFTPTQSTVIMAWGGHISTREDWGFDSNGEPLTAGGINGSPYHMRTESWSLNNIGNQDRSLQTALSGPICPEFLCRDVQGNQTQCPESVCPNVSVSFGVPASSGATTFVWEVDGDATASGSTTNPTFSVITAKHCGSFTVRVKLGNASGFETICETTIPIVDTEKPKIFLDGVDQGEDGVKTDLKECGATTDPPFGTLSYSDNCNPNITPANPPTVVDEFPDGGTGSVEIDGVTYCWTKKTTTTWIVEDYCGNTNTFTHIVYEVDTKPPFFSVGDITVECDEPVNPDDYKPTAFDDCDGSPVVTLQGTSEEGDGCSKTITWTWRATDHCGHYDEHEQHVTIIDETAPTYTSTPSDKTVSCDEEWSFDPPTADDNCNEVTIDRVGEDETTPGNCAGNYTVKRTWQAKDACGNAADPVSQTVTVQDTKAPEISEPEDKTIDCEDEVTFDKPTATDNCSGATVMKVGDDVVTPGNCAGNYTVTRTWKAVDDCGNESGTVDQTVTVQDTKAPTIDEPEDKTINCDDPVEFDKPGASDNCSGATVEKVGDDVREGGENCYTITRTWKAIDGCGNESGTVDQKITVVDNVAPTIDSDAGDDADLGCNPADINSHFSAPTFSDNCDASVDVTFEDVDGGEACNKTRTRTWTATDNCGNTTTTSQTLSWKEDTTSPELSGCPADVTVQCYADVPAPAEVTANDNCDGALTVNYDEQQTNERSSCNNTITRTWWATDECGNSSSCVQTITVNDDTAPTIDKAAGDDKDLGCNPENIEGNFSAPEFSDNCDAELDIKVDDTPGEDGCIKTWKRTWTATDDCGNSTSTSQTLTWKEDTTPPDLSGCPSDVTVQCYADVPAPAEVTANDNCDGALTVNYDEQQTNQGSSCNNTITRTWWATDECGNSSSCVQTITVNDDTAPTIDKAAGDDKDLGCNPENIEGNFSAPEFSDNCDAELDIKVDDTPGEDGCIKTWKRTWTATDDCGNSTSTSQTLTWKEDTTPPDLSGCPADVTVQCYADVPAPAEVTANDNCDGALTVNYDEQQTNQGSSCNNTITRTWWATDECGNSSACTQTIIVNDNTDPELQGVPDDITIQCGTDLPAWPEVTATDNCDQDVPVETSQDDPVDEGCGVYSVTRHWSATDDCGNSTSASQKITITPILSWIEPTIPEDVTFECQAGAPGDPQAQVCTYAGIIEATVTGPETRNLTGTCEKQYDLVWTASYPDGACTSPAPIEITQHVTVTCCADFCTYTQGYYGNPGGIACTPDGPMTTKDLIEYSIGNWGGQIVIGKPGHSFTINAGDAQHIIDILPGGGPSKVINGDILASAVPNSMLKQGRLNNGLLAQTITLALNMGIAGINGASLGDFQLKSGLYLVTQDVVDCGDDIKTGKECKYEPAYDSNTDTWYWQLVYNPYHSFTLNEKVVCYLNSIGAANVQGLYDLASAALGGEALPMFDCEGVPTKLSLGDIQQAVDLINNAFDQCRLFAGYVEDPNLCTPPAEDPTPEEGRANLGSVVTLKAFPNPYDDKIVFEISSKESGKATLDLYNMAGQKFATVFDGDLIANRKQTITYEVPYSQRKNIVYHFNINGKNLNGVLLRPN